MRLHFEVGMPDDPDEPLYDEVGGFLEGERVVVRFCGVEGEGGTLYEGDEVEAGVCGGSVGVAE